jgi:hypothetical protein
LHAPAGYRGILGNDSNPHQWKDALTSMSLIRASL